MDRPKEPQSYGSGGDWQTGNVDEEVNRQKGHPSAQHGDFYESRRDSEETHEHQGGKVSPEQIEENAQPGGQPDAGGDVPPRNVSTEAGGAKRLSYFRDRDYKP
ncbi:MAG TPA: hypothetical protein VJZ76_10175 [Thermoanaerobaculia bacterium]|nr:hypothetical protein [Thermoanaerobaculia bacterium]